MPHCILEYSQNLEQEVPPMDLLEAVQEACIESELFQPTDIKLRAFSCKHFITGGAQDAFIHVTVRILSGRTQEQKTRLSQSVLEALCRFALKQVSLTVEILEMDNESYMRKVIPL